MGKIPGIVVKKGIGGGGEYIPDDVITRGILEGVPP